MYYNLYNISKANTSIKGYWKDETGKVYIDNIRVDRMHKKPFKKVVKELFKEGEKAILYRLGNKGIVLDANGKTNILNKRIEYKLKNSFSNYTKIKELMNKYGGCTVYSKKGYIIIEVFTKG